MKSERITRELRFKNERLEKQVELLEAKLEIANLEIRAYKLEDTKIAQARRMVQMKESFDAETKRLEEETESTNMEVLAVQQQLKVKLESQMEAQVAEIEDSARYSEMTED
jgi:hypothetical protein